jgi:hypothetical protein
MKMIPKSYRLQSVRCAPGAKMTMTIQPTGPFLCKKVIMAIEGGPFICTRLRVGHVDQLLGLTPCAIFAATGRHADGSLTSPNVIAMNTCHTAVSISIDVQNAGDIEGAIELQLDGLQAEV